MRRDNRNFIDYTNISDTDMTLFHLVKQGYGTYKELCELPGETIIDMIEMENIQSDIEKYEYEQAKNGRGN